MRKQLEGETTITRAEAARGVSDVFGGGSGDGVFPFGSVDVEGVSAGGVGTSRHTISCSHYVHESPTLNKSRSIDYPKYYDPSDVIKDVFFCCALMAIYDDIVFKSAAEQRSIDDVLKEYEFND
ncbi:hypothetical protein K7X08_032314 [Anisodus acutangulus]|uniref:Uncharacterized protein n=1 Tax=Anisodus acutangulus TaxID=402998 RepID=A0A9Q1LM52_9SOLA|nr:hypothetical protein K7X08_032314 [Anisodus acutangulus]